MSRRSLGVKLRTLRREVHHASQEDMRDRTGLAVATISRIEAGESSVSPRKLAVYATALGVSEETLRSELVGDGRMLMSVVVGDEGPQVSLVEQVRAADVAEAIRARTPTVDVSGLDPFEVAMVEQLVAGLRLLAARRRTDP